MSCMLLCTCQSSPVNHASPLENSCIDGSSLSNTSWTENRTVLSDGLDPSNSTRHETCLECSAPNFISAMQPLVTPYSPNSTIISILVYKWNLDLYRLWKRSRVDCFDWPPRFTYKDGRLTWSGYTGVKRVNSIFCGDDDPKTSWIRLKSWLDRAEKAKRELPTIVPYFVLE